MAQETKDTVSTDVDHSDEEYDSIWPTRYVYFVISRYSEVIIYLQLKGILVDMKKVDILLSVQCMTCVLNLDAVSA